MTRDELLALSREPNVRAMLDVIAACEGTDGPQGYRTLFGGSLVDSLADHPRRVITRPVGGRPLSSSAAGRYQFLRATWDEVRVRYGLPSFEPQWQDAAAVALIERRGALQHVRAGRLDEAIARLRLEWASLPGSPYGQPVKTMEFVRRRFREAGGLEAQIVSEITDAERPPAPAPAAPAPTTPPTVAEPPVAREEAPVAAPIPAIVAALLPALIDRIPALVKLFRGDERRPVAERNAQAAVQVLEIAREVTGAVNEQQAVERVLRDPDAAARMTRAVQERWYELAPADGGGIEGARAAAAKATGDDDWRAVGYGVVLGLLALIIIAGGGALIWTLLRDPATTAEQRGMLIGAVVALMGSVTAFFFGSSVSSRSKDAAIVRELGQR